MKTKKWLLFLTPLMVILMGACQEKASDTDLSNNTTVETMSRETLNEIATTLASDPSWVNTETMEQLKKGSILLSSLSSQAVLSKTSPYSQSVAIELYRNSTANGMAKGLGTIPYYVGLDPDEYNFPEGVEEEVSGLPVMDEPVFYIDGNSISETTIQLDPNNPTDKLVFFVKQSELANHFPAKVATKPSTPQPGTYITFVGAKLKDKMDESDEEFELYMSDGPEPVSDPFNTTSLHEFKGQDAENDASGRPRDYPDIEETNSMQTADIAIALKLLGGASFRIAAIDNDNPNTGGEYNRQSGSSSQIGVDYFDMSTDENQISLNITSKYLVYDNDDLNDDRYVETGVRNITDANLQARMDGGSFMETDNADGSVTELGQINWRFGRVVHN